MSPRVLGGVALVLLGAGVAGYAGNQILRVTQMRREISAMQHGIFERSLHEEMAIRSSRFDQAKPGGRLQPSVVYANIRGIGASPRGTNVPTALVLNAIASVRPDGDHCSPRG